MGRVAQEQRRWEQAEQHYRKALEIFVEFGDDHGSAITLGSLARLWRGSGRETVPRLVAEVGKITAAQAEELLTAVPADDATE